MLPSLALENDRPRAGSVQNVMYYLAISSQPGRTMLQRLMLLATDRQNLLPRQIFAFLPFFEISIECSDLYTLARL